MVTMNTDLCTFARKYIDFFHRHERFWSQSRYRINNSGCPARARRVIVTANSQLTYPVSPLVVPQKGKPGSSRDPFGTDRMAARRTLRFRPAVQMGSSAGESGVMASKVVVVTAARLAGEGQPFALFHIPPWYQEVCHVLFRLFPN